MLIRDYINGHRDVQWYKTYLLEYYLKKHRIDCDSIKTVYDVGARDCIESLKFTELFKNCNVTAFECNPQTIEECRENSKKTNRINLIEKLVTDNPSNKSFYIKDGINIDEGVASMCIPWFPFKEIKVETISLSDTIEADVDLLWIDVQGAELQVLKSLKQKINNIKTIYLEVDIEPRYKTDSNEKTCIELLNNFTIVERIQLGSNEVHTILKHV